MSGELGNYALILAAGVVLLIVAKKHKKRLSVKEYFREAVEASEKNETFPI